MVNAVSNSARYWRALLELVLVRITPLKLDLYLALASSMASITWLLKELNAVIAMVLAVSGFVSMEPEISYIICVPCFFLLTSLPDANEIKGTISMENVMVSSFCIIEIGLCFNRRKDESKVAFLVLE